LCVGVGVGVGVGVCVGVWGGGGGCMWRRGAIWLNKYFTIIILSLLLLPFSHLITTSHIPKISVGVSK